LLGHGEAGGEAETALRSRAAVEGRRDRRDTSPCQQPHRSRSAGSRYESRFVLPEGKRGLPERLELGRVCVRCEIRKLARAQPQLRPVREGEGEVVVGLVERAGAGRAAEDAADPRRSRARHADDQNARHRP